MRRTTLLTALLWLSTLPNTGGCGGGDAQHHGMSSGGTAGGFAPGGAAGIDGATGGGSGAGGVNAGGVAGFAGSGARAGAGGAAGVAGASGGGADGPATPCGRHALGLDETGEVASPECALDGAWYWYDDGAGTEVDGVADGDPPYEKDRGMCLSGHVITDSTYASWGAGVGLLTKAWTGTQAPWDATAHSVIGFEVTVTGSTGLADLRMFADHAPERAEGESPPFVTLDGPGTHRVLLEDFAVPDSWTPNGGERLDPTVIRYLNFQVTGGDLDADFDYCVTNVAPIVADPIDDLEDGDDAILPGPGREGSWYAYGDGTGTQTAAGSTIHGPGGYGGGYAATTAGSGFTNWGARIGLNFHWDASTSTSAPIDATEFAGLRVRVRGTSATGTLKVLPITRDVTPVAEGGTCESDCDDPHFWTVPLDGEWQDFLLPFTHLFQNGTHAVVFDKAQLTNVNFQAPPGGDFEFAVDDVAFYRSAAPLPDPDPGILIELGPRELESLLEPGFGGLWAFPDQAVLRLDLGTTTRFFLSAWQDPNEPGADVEPGVNPNGQPTFALDAPDITSLDTATPVRVLSPGPAPDFDNGYAGLSGLYRHSDGRLYGFYHAEDWLTDTGDPTPLIPGTGTVPGFYASVAAAVSDDDGLNWTKLGQVLTAPIPKDWPDTGDPYAYDQGVCGPGAVLDRSGRYLYLYYTDNTRRDGRAVQLSLARADLRQGPPSPGQFQKYYYGRFASPGLGGADAPLPGIDPFLVNPVRAYGHPVWSEAIQRYVMVLNLGTWDDAAGALDRAKSGIYILFSQDGLYWSQPRQLVADSIYFEPDESFSYMGTLLFDDESGASGWLVYGHSDTWGDPTHYLVGHRIELRLPEVLP